MLINVYLQLPFPQPPRIQLKIIWWFIVIPRILEMWKNRVLRGRDKQTLYPLNPLTNAAGSKRTQRFMGIVVLG